MLPSKKTISARFPNLSPEEVKEFRKILERYEPEKCLEKINTLIEGYGIEYIQETIIQSYSEFNGIEYVNMGDTYITTLIYDYRKERYYICSWGDYVEKEFKRFFEV